MKRYLIYITIGLTTCLTACTKMLELEPKDKISAEVLFADPAGVKVYMANLYYQLPVEDFAFFRDGFNFNSGNQNNNGLAPAHQTDEASHSQTTHLIGDGDFQWWNEGYKLIRDVNILVDAIPTLNIVEEERKNIIGEAAFIRAYAYFALVKRYGGVPLVLTAQEYTGDAESLRIPRSTEEETWDFVLSELDLAAENLPDSWSADNQRRATKWAAFALKSRAALHAASIAKFGANGVVDGEATRTGLVGVNSSQANKYYQACIDASNAVMSSGRYQLYRANPSTPAEAANNYQQLFQNPNQATEEAIFIKGFYMPGASTAHNYDIWYQPNQTANGWPHPGRMNPTLELVDEYESYNNPGTSSPIVTMQNGEVSAPADFDVNAQYKHFDSPLDIFEGKDARLAATIILPGSTWKGVPMVIQAGFVAPDGSTAINTLSQITVGETTYYTYGGNSVNSYSGFNAQGGNYTRSGFLFKKFLNEEESVVPAWSRSTTDFIDLRYAEVLLNYAEAVAESGLGDASVALTALNATRIRAGHTTEIPLTLENVLRERKVELAFEHKRIWDLIRRREYHTAFNNRRVQALQPILDLRETPAKYIMVRTYTAHISPRTFAQRSYYRSIPGISANGLVQNPGY